MQVKLRFGWFASGDGDVLRDGRLISGRYYGKGVHDMPDDLKPFLPSDAVILEGPVEDEPIHMPAATLRDFDSVRAEGDIVTEVVEQAEKAAKRTRTK